MTALPRTVSAETGRGSHSKLLPYALGAGAILGLLAISALVNAKAARTRSARIYRRETLLR